MSKFLLCNVTRFCGIGFSMQELNICLFLLIWNYFVHYIQWWWSWMLNLYIHSDNHQQPTWPNTWNISIGLLHIVPFWLHSITGIWHHKLQYILWGGRIHDHVNTHQESTGPQVRHWLKYRTSSKTLTQVQDLK